jgi:hypothetical protein
MRNSDWDIRREGRAWVGEEAGQRYDLTPEKLEMIKGKLLWDDDQRIKLLGLLLENVGADQAVRMGNRKVWRDALEALEATVDAFHVDVELTNPSQRAERERIAGVVVRTNVMMSVFPAATLDSLGIIRERSIALQRANGDVFQRWSGAAIITIDGRSTIDDVIFAEPGDEVIVGWRALSGLNLRFDPLSRRLVDAGPVPAAAVA